jgi:phosphate transport system substrate-binding protein
VFRKKEKIEEMSTRRKKGSLLLAGLLIVTLLMAIVGCQQATPTEEPVEDPTETPTEAPSEPSGEAGGQLQLAGSSTVQPLAQALAEAFMAQNPDVGIDVQGGGSSVGVKSAAEGTTPIGNASRALKDSEIEEYPDLIAHTIARDGIAIVVHPDVPVDGVSKDEVRQIFAGEITNWSEVGGPDENIVVVSREEGSGTRGAFEEMVMGEEALIVDTALLQPSNGAVKTTVASTPLSIGYISFGYLDDSVKALAIDGVEPTVANAQSDEYPVVRPLNMVTKGEPTGLAKAFLDFIMSDEGQAIVAEEYIPVSGGAAESGDEGEAEAELSGELQLAGSSTVQPLAQSLAEAFMAQNPDVGIDVQGGGSSVGVKSAAEGTTPIGNASRALKDSEMEEYPDLIAHTIARDGIAIVVHPEVPVDGLSKDEVRQIFAGEITNWNEVGGPDENIIVVSREEGSGTRGAFEDMVMGESLIVDTALLQPSNGAVKTTVASTPLSIGYISFGYLDDSVKALAVDGVDATVANADSGEYPVVRPLNMVTNGEPTGLAKAFLDFIMSDEGQAIVAEEYIPVK